VLRTDLPRAIRVLDASPAASLGFDTVDDSAAGCSTISSGTARRRDDPLHGIRRELCRGAEKLSPLADARLLAGVEAGDPGP
jgi:hypothetical protein